MLEKPWLTRWRSSAQGTVLGAAVVVVATAGLSGQLLRAALALGRGWWPSS
jgi:hypothetical protein